MAFLVRHAPAALRLLGQISRRAAADAQLMPPSGRRERALALAAHATFLLGVVISAGLVLGLLAVRPSGHWIDWAKLAVGLALMAEGYVLMCDWQGARRLTLWRIRDRRGGPSIVTLRRRLARRLASPALQLLGCAWFAIGFLAAGLGLDRLF